MTHVHLTDRMPDVRHARDTWTAADREHLAACVECAAEWRVVAMVRTTDALTPVDANVVATSVLDRLRREPVVLPLSRRATWRMGIVGMAVAASLTLAFLTQSRPRGRDTQMVAVHHARILPELDVLLADELELVLTFIAPEKAEPTATVPRLGELTEDELATLLAEVEG